MIAGALKKGGNPKSMLIGTAIGSGLGSLSEYGYRKATKQDKKYQKEVDKRVLDYHEKLKNIPDQPNWKNYKDEKKYIHAIKIREKKINEAEEVRNKALNDIKRNISKNPGKYNILRKYNWSKRKYNNYKTPRKFGSTSHQGSTRESNYI